jgi:HEAT repeat protein
MAQAMDEIRAILEPDEPDYAQASQIGTAALPFLRELIVRGDPMLASKATYLASLISPKDSVEVLLQAARSPDPAVRVAAASAAANLPGDLASELLQALVIDRDRGVRRIAFNSVRPGVSPELSATIEQASTADPEASIREAAARALRRLHKPESA